jgi:hypothetical protein
MDVTQNLEPFAYQAFAIRLSVGKYRVSGLIAIHPSKANKRVF